MFHINFFQHSNYLKFFLICFYFIIAPAKSYHLQLLCLPCIFSAAYIYKMVNNRFLFFIFTFFFTQMMAEENYNIHLYYKSTFFPFSLILFYFLFLYKIHSLLCILFLTFFWEITCEKLLPSIPLLFGILNIF